VEITNVSDGGVFYWLLRFYAFGLLAVVAMAVCAAFGTYVYFAATLPPMPDLARYQSESPCEVCHGARLKPEALAVKIAGKNIAEISTLAIRPARDWFAGLEGDLTDKQMEIARRILKEINDRLRFLVDVGLDYLNLSRGSGTLSGGESQRIRLASQIGSGLTGVLYVLDRRLPQWLQL